MIKHPTKPSYEASFLDQQAAFKGLILVVDDDHLTHRLIWKIIGGAGLKQHNAQSVAEARAILEEFTPDLILCDVNMPDEDGISFCRQMRLNAKTEDIPIIFFTSCNDNETINKAFEAGASDYVVKPIRKVEIVSRCKRQIDEYRRRSEARAKITDLDKQNTSKTRFLTVATHDLRNPIASIRGISQFLESGRFGSLNESQQEMVRTIIEASESMLDLVEDLLDVSKIELNEFEPAKELLAPAEIMEQVVKLQQPAANKKKITLLLEDLSQGALSGLDRRLMLRALENLVSNAIKFSPAETTITLKTQRDEDWISLSILDGGPGIPPNEFDKLFKEFSRTSNMPTGGESTSGIGLYTVKRIINSHKGTITAENRPEGGAHFKIKIKRTQ